MRQDRQLDPNRSILLTTVNIQHIRYCQVLVVAATAFLGIVYGASHGDGCLPTWLSQDRGADGELGDIVLAKFLYVITPPAGS